MIIQNQVLCHLCGDKPFSVHRHDYSSCKCGNVSVDGGMDYLRRTFKSPETWEEKSIEMSDETVEAAKVAIRQAIDTGRNELGILCAVARTLFEKGVINASTTNSAKR